MHNGCLQFEVQTKSWAFQVMLHYYSMFLYEYIKTKTLPWAFTYVSKC